LKFVSKQDNKPILFTKPQFSKPDFSFPKLGLGKEEGLGFGKEETFPGWDWARR